MMGYVGDAEKDLCIQRAFCIMRNRKYTATGYPMANGEYPYVGCAASCDFPIGTVLVIEGIGTYVIKDVCPTSGVIDIYMNSYDECIQFGRQTANVYT